MNGVSGTTRDVSGSGLYFETAASFAIGSEVSFAIDIDTPSGAMVLSCKGKIVRAEKRGDLQGVAVRILDSRLNARPANRTAIDA